jgi:ubiquinol-cytochrome c reductase iron-sulfur subunit
MKEFESVRNLPVEPESTYLCGSLGGSTAEMHHEVDVRERHRCRTVRRAGLVVNTTRSIELQGSAERRRFLVRATAAVGAVGLACAMLPFIESWQPSERARALGGPVTLDPTKTEPGQMTVVVWRRQPIYVVHRTPAMLALLGNHDALLKDPQSQYSDQPAYAHNTIRAREARLFVTIGICTHLGCLPKARFTAGDPVLGASWPGGFLCPCHGSRFDLAGRVFSGSPASVNLVIPPYAFADTHQLVIGMDSALPAET